jgi:hypothetical protein
MNERILKLAKEAGMRSPDLFKLTVSHMSTDTLEKFAELIVGHAIECVRDVLRDENSDLSYGAASQVQNRIKQHFGVEL